MLVFGKGNRLSSCSTRVVWNDRLLVGPGIPARSPMITELEFTVKSSLPECRWNNDTKCSSLKIKGQGLITSIMPSQRQLHEQLL